MCATVYFLCYVCVPYCNFIKMMLKRINKTLQVGLFMRYSVSITGKIEKDIPDLLTHGKITDAGKELEKVSKQLKKLLFSKTSKKQSNKNYGGMRYFNRANFYSNKMQSCIIKVSYESGNKEKNIEFLKKYIQQENKKEVVDKPVVFNAEYDIVPEEKIEKYISKEADKNFFRMIVSPGSEKVPMELAIRHLMKRIDVATGYSLRWFAAKHTDTDTTHCHILINGKDMNKKDVIFESRFISKTIRQFAQETCTELIGFQTDEQVEIARKKLPLSRRYCPRLDNEIYRNAVKLKVDFKENRFGSYIVDNFDNEISQRLAFLAKLGFAKREDKRKPRRYKLEKKWIQKLKNIGRYNSYLDARNEVLFTNGYNLELYNCDMGKISGVITRIYKMNYEDSWTNAYVVENKKTDRCWYVPLRKKPDEKLMNKEIIIAAKENSKGKLEPNIILKSIDENYNSHLL